MKALSLIQPWASLIVLGEKRIETRSWPTTHRGPLAIHASKSMPDVCRLLCQERPFREALARHGLTADTLPLGKVLGIVHLDDCLPTDDLPALTPDERAFGDFRRGRFGWLLSRPHPLAGPLPYRGSQGLWTLPDDILATGPRAAH